jgi:hypothetical protein
LSTEKTRLDDGATPPIRGLERISWSSGHGTGNLIAHFEDGRRIVASSAQPLADALGVDWRLLARHYFGMEPRTFLQWHFAELDALEREQSGRAPRAPRPTRRRSSRKRAPARQPTRD